MNETTVMNKKLNNTSWEDIDPDYYEYVHDWQAEVGMVRWGITLGFKDTHPYIYEMCPECKETKRWVRIDRSGGICKSCAKKVFWRERNGDRRAN